MTATTQTPEVARTQRSARRRLLALAVLSAMAGLSVAGRLIQLQVLNHDQYRTRARLQQEDIRTLEPRRGEIRDRAGRELALNVRVDNVAAHPARVKDPEAAARTLAPLLGMSSGDILARLSSKSPYVYLKRKLPESQSLPVAQAGIEGIVLEPGSLRVYPNRSLAAHALGFVGRDGIGLGGLEHAFESEVHGTDGKALELSDAKGVLFSHLQVKPAVPGRSLGLTLDLTVQHILEEELQFAVRRTRARAGSAVALDPATGEVLAMASWPTFNPNDLSSSTEDQRRDRVVVSAYEPGSTFKVITAAAALEAGLVRPSEVFYCGNGSYRVARGHVIRDHKPFKDLTFTQVLARSSNVGAIKAGMRLKPAAFHETIRRFGFGEKTGVGLPGEQAGIVHAPADWSLLSQPEMSIGQEIMVTPLQMLAAVAAVGNDGRWMRPWIAREIRDPDGRVLERNRPPAAHRVMREDNARTLSRMLQKVVDGGSGAAAAVPGYSVAGKTGTAQKSEPGKSGYVKGKYMSSFVGFVPSRQPRLAALFVIDEPRGKLYYGGDVAAPAFGRFAARALPALGVLPDRGVQVRPRKEPAPGAVWAATRREGTRSTMQGTVPDVVGLSSRDAVAELTRRGIVPQLSGAGWVVTQEPAPGTAVTELHGPVALRLDP